MHRFVLIPHPDFPPLGLRGVEVDVRGRSDDVLLTYRMIGAGRVVWPDVRSAERADDLWRATCFELFLLFNDDERYVEFNFSPSTRWAAFAFEGHREGKVNLPREVPPRIERLNDGVAVDCDLGGLPHGELRLGLSAVVEEEGGRFSYWALAHPPGRPDFHHAACFVARLPAAQAS